MGTWRFSASGHWRITFIIIDADIVDLNLGDYH
jgi:hypothetical protein